MKVTQLKINNAIQRQLTKLKEYGREAPKNANSTLSLQWYPRLNLFKRSRLIFNPGTMVATSYDWYEIAKVINGKLVVNDYRYSVTTAKQVNQLKILFYQLDLSYVTLEAPEGLQDLSRAKRREIQEWARREVANKYSRSPNKPLKKVKRLDVLNIKYSKRELREALKLAEQNRSKKLEKAREEKRIRQVELVITEREDHSSVNDALIVHPYPRAWIPEYEKRDFKIKALQAGFKKVIVNVVTE